MDDELVFDIECDSLDLESAKVHCLVIRNEHGATAYDDILGKPFSVGVARLQDAHKIIAHNCIRYDIPILERVFNVKFDMSKVVDTLVLSRLARPERPNGHSLEAWGEYLGYPKPQIESFDEYTPEILERCQADVELNWKVWQKLRPMFERMPKAVEIEHKTAWSIHKMCTRGVHFDAQKGLKLLDVLLSEQEELEAEISELLGYRYKIKGLPKVLKVSPNRRHWGRGILDPGVEYQEVTHAKLSPTSRQDIAWYFKRKYGWNPTQKTETGQAKVDGDILRAMPWPEAETIAKLFDLQKLLGYLNGEPKANGSGGGWLHHVKHGRLHANFIPLTAVTGRPSCKAPNLQQVPTDKRARELFGPRPGWVQVGVDADGQELRTLGHYLHPYDKGEYGNEVVNGDIHSKVQHLIGFETRKGTKPVEYALIYGAGNAKLGLISAKDKASVGKTLKRKLESEGSRIRKAIMRGVSGFEDLLCDVRSKASSAGRLRGLDGRTLWVRSAHSALNLLLQSAGIIHMKAVISMVDSKLQEAGLKEEQDYALILWVHDELQFEARPEVAELVGKTAADCVHEAGVWLKFRVPMTGTYLIGNNWSETH